MRVLIVEDEKLLADSVKTLLEKNDFEVECVYDGISGEEYGETGIYDLIILDVMLPGADGFKVAKYLKSVKCNTPILMLTAKSEVEDRIEGLSSGADYYLTKPFDSRELLTCVNVLLRRRGAEVDELRFGNTGLDLSTSILSCGDKSIRLSDREFDMMRIMLQSGEKNLSKETLLVRIWGYDSNATENHVEVYAGFLRKKLKSIGSNIRIEALRRQGYHLEVSEDAE